MKIGVFNEMDLVMLLITTFAKGMSFVLEEKDGGKKMKEWIDKEWAGDCKGYTKDLAMRQIHNFEETARAFLSLHEKANFDEEEKKSSTEKNEKEEENNEIYH